MCKFLFILIRISFMALPLHVHAHSFTIGVENQDYLPYFTYQKRQYQGITRELLDAFASSQGYIFRYKALPVKRLFNDFLAGKVDFKFPDNSNWQAELKQRRLQKGQPITYSDYVLRFVDGVMVLPENKGTGLRQFKKLGTILGFTPWAWLEQIKAGSVKKLETSNYHNLINMAISKRIDGIYANVVVGAYQLRQMNKKKALVFDPSLPHSDDYYFLSSINYPQIIKRFNQFMRDNKALIEQLKAKYKVEEGLP